MQVKSRNGVKEEEVTGRVWKVRSGSGLEMVRPATSCNITEQVRSGSSVGSAV